MKLKVVRITVDILMFIILILVLITPYLLERRFGTLTSANTFLGWHAGEWHQYLGWAFAGLMVIHLFLNYKWVVATTKNFFKVTRACRSQYIVMVLLIGFMIACVISGGMWGARGRDASDAVRMVHTLTAWASVWLIGIHMGVHLVRFMSFFESKKPKK